MTASARDAAELVARERYGKLLAYLASRGATVHAAEDALADAFAAALATWPRDGIPEAPEAWLLAAARRKLIDGYRRAGTRDAAQATLARLARESQHAFDERAEMPDERLAMMFACAHPAIAANVRAPLILQVVLGLDAARIAAGFLVAPAAMSQRLVRAKQKIAAARIPLRIPDDAVLTDRLDAVLDAVYAAFTAGWDDGGDDAAHGLDEEATWLARFLAAEYPEEPEVLALLALMRFCASRRSARRDADGAFVPLDVQDARRWDGAAIAEAEALLERAARRKRLGRYQLEAAIQSAHAVRRFGRTPDPAALLLLHDGLVALTGSTIARVNRAVALAAVRGPQAALADLDALDDARLAGYQPYHAARAALLGAAGRRDDATAAYTRAIALATDPAVRAHLARTAASLSNLPGSAPSVYDGVT